MIIGLSPWRSADRRPTMCNELAVMRNNEDIEWKSLIESRKSLQEEKEMQRSLEIALAEWLEHALLMSPARGLSVASDDNYFTQIEEFEGEDDEEDKEE